MFVVASGGSAVPAAGSGQQHHSAELLPGTERAVSVPQVPSTHHTAAVCTHSHRSVGHMTILEILKLYYGLDGYSVCYHVMCYFIGLLSSWFKRHLSLLQGVLPIILESLTRPSLASCAALAFKDVCGECSNELSTIASQLIPHCQVKKCYLDSKTLFNSQLHFKANHVVITY